MKESKRQLQLPYETSEDDEDESPPDIIAAAAVAAAIGAPPPLPPPGTPPLIYGRGVALHPAGAPVGDPMGLNPFGPLPADAIGGTPATSATTGSSAAAAAAAAEAQQYVGTSSMSSLDGSCSVQQWPAGEVSSSSGGRSGCPVYVMLPLDTVWVVERESQKVRKGVALVLLLVGVVKGSSGGDHRSTTAEGVGARSVVCYAAAGHCVGVGSELQTVRKGVALVPLGWWW